MSLVKFVSLFDLTDFHKVLKDTSTNLVNHISSLLAKVTEKNIKALYDLGGVRGIHHTSFLESKSVSLN